MRLENYTIYTYQSGDLVFGYRPGLPPGALFDPSEFVPGSAENFANSDLIANGYHEHDGNGNAVALFNYTGYAFLSVASLSSEQAYVISTSIGEAFSIYGDKSSVFGGQVSIGTPLSSNYAFEVNNSTFAGGGVFSATGVALSGVSSTGIGGQFQGITGVQGYSTSGNAVFGSAQGGGTGGFFQGGIYTETYGIGNTKHASAVMQADSVTQGVLIPRMTTTQINAIPSPSNGLLVHNTTLGCPCFYDGTGWRKVSHSAM